MAQLFASAHFADEPELPPGSPPTRECFCLAQTDASSTLCSSQIRGTLVHHSDCSFYRDWYYFVPALFLLSHKMASSFRSPYQAQRFMALMSILNFTSFNSSAFSPHEAHAHQAFFGWILPTIRISEFTVLQIVGLDAAVVCIRFYRPGYLSY
jgi:hypothetical protein